MDWSSVNWSDWWGPALTAGVGLTGALLNNSLQQDQLKEQKSQAEQNKQDALALDERNFEQQKELLQLQASLRPGPVPPFTGWTNSQRVAAMQGQDQNNLIAIKNMIEAYQRGLGR